MHAIYCIGRLGFKNHPEVRISVDMIGRQDDVLIMCMRCEYDRSVSFVLSETDSKVSICDDCSASVK